jgi:branched-chain amino acid transport system permease protein
MIENIKSQKTIWLLVVLFVLMLPFLSGHDNYILHVGISIAFNVALATSMWLILSLGFLSFAHAAFMGIGAYTSALLFLKLGLSLWITFWIAGLVAGVIALALAVPLMRTRAVYFFMASWAVGEVVKRLFAYFKNFFGGWTGLFDIAPPKLALVGLNIDFSSRTAYYYLTAFFAIAVVLTVYRINKSRIGWINWGIHDGEVLAEHLGINTLKFKVTAFTIACVLAGFTGAMYAHYHTYINPKTFDVWQSEFALVFIIVGGLTTVAGPIYGATVLTIIDELLRPTGYYRVIFFGVVLILTVLFMQDGLESLPGKFRKFKARFIDKKKVIQEEPQKVEAGRSK